MVLEREAEKRDEKKTVAGLHLVSRHLGAPLHFGCILLKCKVSRMESEMEDS